MKQLILVRHAKSDWGDPSLDDFERPLSGRGKRDAPLMAERLIDKDIKIDLFITSPAKRAAKTAKIFAEAYKAKKDDILIREELYGAGEHVFFDVIAKTDNEHKTIAIFSHNPGITDFANLLTATHIDNIPTSGVFAIKADCKKWKEFADAKKEFWFFDYPKAGVSD